MIVHIVLTIMPHKNRMYVLFLQYCSNLTCKIMYFPCRGYENVASWCLFLLFVYILLKMCKIYIVMYMLRPTCMQDRETECVRLFK
jgi:hypothetical protein